MQFVAAALALGAAAALVVACSTVGSSLSSDAGAADSAPDAAPISCQMSLDAYCAMSGHAPCVRNFADAQRCASWPHSGGVYVNLTYCARVDYVGLYVVDVSTAYVYDHATGALVSVWYGNQSESICIAGGPTDDPYGDTSCRGLFPCGSDADAAGDASDAVIADAGSAR